MDRDALYFHFSNLGLVLIGLLSIQSILNTFVFMIVTIGTIAGFIVSWQMMNSRVKYTDTFIGMLSLACVVIILGSLFETAITFKNLLKIFSTTLAWLTLFQSFGLRTGKSYAVLQFIAVSLFISSVALALEQEMFYLVLSALFLYIFIFVMRLNLICEKKRKGSLIVGNREEIMSLSQQIKIGAIMFSMVLIVASFVYPFVPRFESLSLRQIPSTLLGLIEQVPVLKLSEEEPMTVKEDRKVKEEQVVDDQSRERETAPGSVRKYGFDDTGTERGNLPGEKPSDASSVTRFPAKDFDKDIDIFEIEALVISSDKDEVPLNSWCRLEAELMLTDGSVIPATRLVDWKVYGTAKVSIDDNGNLVPKEKGDIYISASYMGTFSNDVYIKILEAVGPAVKKNIGKYFLIILVWVFTLALVSLAIWVFMRSKRLGELAVKNPREFIKEAYISICRGFRLYGIYRLNYLGHWEFYDLSRGIIYRNPEPMQLLTQGVLEARFSRHTISSEHSKRTLDLFHEVKDTILRRQGYNEIWKKLIFTLFLLDVLLIPREIKT